MRVLVERNIKGAVWISSPQAAPREPLPVPALQLIEVVPRHLLARPNAVRHAEQYNAAAARPDEVTGPDSYSSGAVFVRHKEKRRSRRSFGKCGRYFLLFRIHW